MSSPTFDPMIAGLQTILDLRIAQHGLTATNLANADTPGFRAKEIDFEHVLADALHEPGEMQRTDARHVSAGGADAAHPVVTELDPAPWAVDGNSVLPERELARMNSNALMYQAVLRGLDSKLDQLRFAVSDGRA